MSKTVEKKYKLKRRYDEYKQHEGTHTTQESKTDRSQQEEVDIYKVIEKYNATGIIPKTRNEEPMYLDHTGLTGLTLDEVMRQRQQMEEYFYNMPAKVRKIFGDNIDEFVGKYRNGDFNNFIETGALTEKQIDEIMKDERAKFNQNINEAIKEQNLMTLEQAREIIAKEQKPTEGENNA